MKTIAAIILITQIVSGIGASGENIKSKIGEETQTYYCEWLDVEFTREEYDLLCRTTYCEAGNQGYNTQVAVCLTMLNRLGSNKFPDSIEEVIYQDGAYVVTGWSDFETREWNYITDYAVKTALAYTTHPLDMFYFRNSHFHDFGVPYLQLEDLYFSTAS